MKKLFLLAAVVMGLAGCASPRITTTQMDPKSANYERVIELPDLNTQSIYERSLQWYAISFHSSKQAIEYQNKNEGKIIAKGNDIIYHKSSLGSVPVPIGFTIIQDIKDNRTRVSFENFGLNDLYGNKYESIYQEAWTQMQPKLKQYADAIEWHIKSKNQTW